MGLPCFYRYTVPNGTVPFGVLNCPVCSETIEDSQRISLVMGSICLPFHFSPSIFKSGYLVLIITALEDWSRKRASPFYNLQTPRFEYAPFLYIGLRSGSTLTKSLSFRT